LLYLAILAALAWFLIESPDVRESIGSFGVALIWIFIISAAFLTIARWSQLRRSPTIFPFRNATGDTTNKNKDKYDALAQNISEMLQFEFRRIGQLLSIPESISLINPVVSKNQVPRLIVKSSGLTSLGSARVDEALGEKLKEFGSIELGAINLPLGDLLSLIVQAFSGGGITGKVQKYGEVVSIVASYGNSIYEATSAKVQKNELSEEDLVKMVVRQLAYRISAEFADFPPSRWQSFRELIEGLEQYHRFLSSGERNLSALDAAEKHFEQAVVEDGKYAWAYYILGKLYEEKKNPDSAFEMYKRAVQLEPTFSAAQLELGQEFLEREYFSDAINAFELAVKHANKTYRPFARTYLGQCFNVLSQKVLSQKSPPIEVDLQNSNRAIKELKRASREYSNLIRSERLRFDFSKSRIKMLKERMVFPKIELNKAYLVLASWHAASLRSFENSDTQNQANQNQRMIKRTRRKYEQVEKKAEDALLHCLDLCPMSNEVHVKLGYFYKESKRYREAQDIFEKARTINFEDKTAILGLGQTFTDQAFDTLLEMAQDYREKPDEWHTLWTEYDIAYAQSLLENLEVTSAADYYWNVIEIIRVQGEAGIDDQINMIAALNGLATVYGGMALINFFKNLDPNPLIVQAKQLLGKALALYPYDNEVYDNFAGLYSIQAGIIELEAVDLSQDEGDGHPKNPIDTNALDETYTAIEEMRRTYALLATIAYVYGESNQALAAELAKTLARSTPEQRTDLEEIFESAATETLMDAILKFILKVDADSQNIYEIEVSPVSQTCLWVAGWMDVKFYKPESGLVFLERALEMGAFPEADLVDYDLATVYQEVKEWEKVIYTCYRMGSQDPYYWRSRILLADSLLSIEPFEINANGNENAVEEQADEPAVIELPLEDLSDLETVKQKISLLSMEERDPETIYRNAIYFAGKDPYRQATALAALGDLVRTKKRFGEAAAYLKEALALVPAYAYPHAILALIYMDMYDYESAIKHWKRVGELMQDLDDPTYHRGLGDVYSSKAVFSSDPEAVKVWRQQAVQEYQHSIQHIDLNEAQDKADDLYTLGNLYVELKQYAEAEAAYLAARETYQGSDDNWYLINYRYHRGLAFVYAKLDRYYDAHLEYKQAIEVCKQSGKMRRELALTYNDMAYYLYAERGINLEEGLELVNHALAELEQIDLDEENKRESRGAYLDTRGWLYYRTGKYDLARADLEAALSLTLGTAYEHGHLALVYGKLAETSEDAAERKRLEAMSKEQWKYALEMDRDGIWADYQPKPAKTEIKQ
jgi:tetratricopeptide (TPR) repeat protein